MATVHSLLVLVGLTANVEPSAALVQGSRDPALFEQVKAKVLDPGAQLGVRFTEGPRAKSPRALTEIFFRKGYEAKAKEVAGELETLVGRVVPRPWPGGSGEPIVVVVGAAKAPAGPSGGGRKERAPVTRLDNTSEPRCVLAFRSDGTKTKLCPLPDEPNCSVKLGSLSTDDLFEVVSTDLRWVLVTTICAGPRTEEIHTLFSIEDGRHFNDRDLGFDGLLFDKFTGAGAQEALVGSGKANDTSIPLSELAQRARNAR